MPGIFQDPGIFFNKGPFPEQAENLVWLSSVYNLQYFGNMRFKSQIALEA